MQFQIEVKGLAALEQQLIAVGVELGEKALRRAAREAMKEMQAEAIRLAPYNPNADSFDYRTGRIQHLRDDIKLRVKKGGKDDSPTAVTIRLGTSRKTRHYAAAIEFGRHEFNQSRGYIYGRKLKYRTLITIGEARAQPFMRPAFHNEKRNVIKLFKAYLTKEIARAVKLKAKRERRKTL